MAELADALDSGSSVRKDVEVRILSWAPHSKQLSLPTLVAICPVAGLAGQAAGILEFRNSECSQVRSYRAAASRFLSFAFSNAAPCDFSYG